MKKIHYVLYICDNEVFLLDRRKNNIIKDKFQSIKEEAIINSSLFTDEFNRFLKQNHIKTSLFGENICFIKNKNMNSVVLEKYEEILKEYFQKLEYKDLEEILKIEKDMGYLLVTKDYIEYYYMKNNEKKNIRVNLSIFNYNVNKAIQHLITFIYKSKKMMIFGNTESISKIAHDINHDYNISTTFPEIHYEFIIQEYKK